MGFIEYVYTSAVNVLVQNLKVRLIITYISWVQCLQYSHYGTFIPRKRRTISLLSTCLREKRDYSLKTLWRQCQYTNIGISIPVTLRQLKP